MIVEVADWWERLLGAQSEPHALIPLLTGAVALVVVLSGGFWRLARNLLTLVHEAGHAVVAVLVGRRLQGILLHSDTSGVTVSRGKRTGPGMVLTSLAGYPAPAFLGLVFSGLIAADLLAMVLVVAAVGVLGVLVMVRNAYGVFTVVTVAGVLGVVAFVAGPNIQAAFVYLITWFMLLGSVRPVFELQGKRRRGTARDSDADQLARLTGMPALLWVLVLSVLALGCLVVGGAWLLEPALPVVVTL
ncbi:MAG: M50 family metallopeptidase [Haloechinothrix sp.]